MTACAKGSCRFLHSLRPPHRRGPVAGTPAALGRNHSAMSAPDAKGGQGRGLVLRAERNRKRPRRRTGSGRVRERLEAVEIPLNRTNQSQNLRNKPFWGESVESVIKEARNASCLHRFADR